MKCPNSWMITRIERANISCIIFIKTAIFSLQNFETAKIMKILENQDRNFHFPSKEI